MSSCNCMLSGREIASYTGANVCMTIARNGTYFTRKLCRWRTQSWFFKLICRGPLCLLWLPARIIWVQNLSIWRISALNQQTGKPAVFSLFALFLLVLFRLYIFFWGRRTYSTYGIGYHFEILSSQEDDTKKELISCPGSNYVSIILHWLMLNAISSKPIYLNVSLLYFTLILENRSKN